MGILEGLAEFSTGATQGVNQGMDLYQKYQTIQDEQQKRQKKQQFESKVQELTQNGGFDDPIKGVRTMADYARELGDIDTYLRYNETANSLQKTDGDRKGLATYQAAIGKDYGTAIQNLNDFAQTMNTGSQYDLQQTGKGYRAIINTNGKKSEVELPDDNAVQGFFMAQTEPYLFKDVGSYIESQQKSKESAAKIGQAGAETELARAKSATEEARRQGEVGLLGAQTAAAGAQSGYYGAQAEKARVEAAAEPAKADLARRQGEADIGYKQALTANVGQPADPELSLALARTAPPDPLPGDVVDPLQNIQSRNTIASSIRALGTDTNTAIGLTDAMMQSGQYTIDPKNNTVYLPDGTPVKIAAQGWQELLRIRPMSKVQVQAP